MAHDRSFAKMERTIRRHYTLDRKLSNAEVQAEIANLHRKRAKGNLDDGQESLYAALDLRPPAENGLAWRKRK